MEEDPAHCGWCHSQGRVGMGLCESGGTELSTSRQPSELVCINLSLLLIMDVIWLAAWSSCLDFPPKQWMVTWNCELQSAPSPLGCFWPGCLITVVERKWRQSLSTEMVKMSWELSWIMSFHRWRSEDTWCIVMASFRAGFLRLRPWLRSRLPACRVRGPRFNAMAGNKRKTLD